jgi:AcrR family transcriptional regulator
MADRQAAYVQEMERVVDAAYRVIERTGSFDPTLREILRESGLSTQAFYKHFRSKDELLLVLLDDGRRRLVGYLVHRMEKASDPAGRVRAWIEGVLAQAADPGASARTRPFLVNQERLMEQFPDEQRESAELLVELLAGAVGELPGPARDERQARRDAQAIYHLTFGTMQQHITYRTRPSAGEVNHLVQFSLKGAAAS